MEITTVVGCVNKCPYCPQDVFIAAYAKRSEITRMSFDVYKTCIDKLPAEESIWFSGMAEPWLNPECTKMALYAYQKGLLVGAHTTLVGMKPADVRLLEPIPFARFWIHILPCGGQGERYINENYLEVLDAVSSSKIKTRYSAHSKNAHPAIVSLLKKKGIKINFFGFHTWAGNLSLSDAYNPTKRERPIICRRNMRTNVLLPNGDVILCSMDYGMRYMLGNLLSSDYKSLYRSKVFLDLKRDLRKTSSDSDILCRYCVFASTKKSRLMAYREKIAKFLPKSITRKRGISI